MANDRTVPGTGTPDAVKPSEPMILPPEIQARINNARAQFGRVEKALQASGVRASGLIVETGSSTWSAVRDSETESWDGRSWKGADFLRVMTPAAETDDSLFNRRFEADIMGFISIDPRKGHADEIVTAHYEEIGEIEDIVDDEPDSAIYKVAGLLDQLGFPPAEETPTKEAVVEMGPDDVDGISTARAGQAQLEQSRGDPTPDSPDWDEHE